MATHTYAILPVSPATYAEIRESLTKAGYWDSLHKQDDGTELIDMHGIAVKVDPKLDSPPADSSGHRPINRVVNPKPPKGGSGTAPPRGQRAGGVTQERLMEILQQTPSYVPPGDAQRRDIARWLLEKCNVEEKGLYPESPTCPVCHNKMLLGCAHGYNICVKYEQPVINEAAFLRT